MAAALAASASLLPSPQAEADERPSATGKRLTLLHFTDTHAMLETHPEYVPGEVPQFQMMGGFARLKTALDRHRSTATGPAFVFDGGDEFQGSGPAAWSKGEVIVDPLNALGADAFVPGNWEPVYGPARFKELMSRLKSPVTCFNFHDVTSGQRLFQPHLILERDGVRVAVVGVTDILASKRQAPAEFEGMDTTRMEGLRQFVRDLREREKPDLVVAVMHTGITISRQLARDVPEFDVVLSGHTHERTPEPILEGHVIVVEPGCFGSFLGRLDLVLKPTGGVASHNWQLIPIRQDDFPEDSHVKEMVDRNLAPHRARMRQRVCQTQTPLYRYDVLETSADNLITDAVRETAHADIGLSNGFRFGPPILAGDVYNADVWNLLPMDTRLKVGWVTGRELRQYLENELELVFSKDPMKLSGGWGPRASGMTLEYNANAAPGKRLISIRVGGNDAQDDAHYMLAGCEREGEPIDVVCRHKGTHDVKVLPVMLHAALKDYFKAHPVVSPMREGRAVAADLAPVVFSQDAVVSDGSKGGPCPSTPSNRARRA
jgi:2',3'-cyclic-nucleotide 2'-phosphodiesterase (5'-nucleotidase family)